MAKKVTQGAETAEKKSVNGKVCTAGWFAVPAVIFVAVFGSLPFILGNHVEDHELELKTSALGEVVTYQFDQKVHYYI